MGTSPASVDAYLTALPPDRRATISAVRKVILEHLPEGYTECIQYGMIAYVVPHSLYPKGYHCDPGKPLQYAALGSQKNHMALYLMTVYGDPGTEQWFRKEYAATGKKLNMGKACLRFGSVDDLALDVIGKLIARVQVKVYIDRVEQTLQRRANPGKTKRSQ